MSIKTLAEDNIKEITEGIIRDMESHDMTQPFVPKWITNLHMNVDGYQYTGWNQFHLNYKYGYSTPIWGTYNQWNKIGLHPAPRSGRPLWQPMTFKTEDKKTGEEKIIQRFKAVAIHSIDDVSGDSKVIEDLKDSLLNRINTATEYARVDSIDKQVSRLNAKITHGSNRACYIPITDEIMMPKHTAFKKTESYYSTLFHEITHWSGHKTRCNRTLSGSFASNDYAFEELIAELGASFHMAKYGMLHTTRQDHVHYLKSWAKALRDKPDALRSACKYASQSFFYIRDVTNKIDSIEQVAV